MDLQQGFVLTRHWRDTPAGTEVSFWLATDQGPRCIRLPVQTSVVFIPEAYRKPLDWLLKGSAISSCAPCSYATFITARFWASTPASTAS